MVAYAQLCITLHNHTASATRVKRRTEKLSVDFQRKQVLPQSAARK
jgi:hypothetical protein